MPFAADSHTARGALSQALSATMVRACAASRLPPASMAKAAAAL